jgi:hypothetical protein
MERTRRNIQMTTTINSIFNTLYPNNCILNQTPVLSAEWLNHVMTEENKLVLINNEVQDLLVKVDSLTIDNENLNNELIEAKIEISTLSAGPKLLIARNIVDMFLDRIAKTANLKQPGDIFQLFRVDDENCYIKDLDIAVVKELESLCRWLVHTCKSELSEKIHNFKIKCSSLSTGFLSVEQWADIMSESLDFNDRIVNLHRLEEAKLLFLTLQDGMIIEVDNKNNISKMCEKFDKWYDDLIKIKEKKKGSIDKIDDYDDM